MSADELTKQILSKIKNSNKDIFVNNLNYMSIVYQALCLSESKPVILVAKSLKEANNWLENAKFLLGENGEDQLLFLPDLDQSPYSNISANPELVMQRMASLHKIVDGQKFSVIITTLKAIASYGISYDTIKSNSCLLIKDCEIERENFITKLEFLQYKRVSLVEIPGTYAIRGCIVDIFCPGMKYPCRIEFFADIIEKIKFFDPQSQIAIKDIDHISFGAVKEICYHKKNLEQVFSNLRNLADEVEYPSKFLNLIINDINDGSLLGADALLPAFAENQQNPLEIIYKSCDIKPILLMPDYSLIENEFNNTYTNYQNNYNQTLLQNRLCFKPELFLSDFNKLKSTLKLFSKIIYNPILSENKELSANIKPTNQIRQEIINNSPLYKVAGQSQVFKPLIDFIKNLKKDHISIFLPCSSEKGVVRLSELLQPYGVKIQALKNTVNLLSKDGFIKYKNPSIHAYCYANNDATPNEGAVFTDDGFAVICEQDIFGSKSKKNKQHTKKDLFKTSLSDLEENDYIVHIDHGIGQYHGLKKLTVNGIEQDYVLLGYAGKDKLYLPVSRINLIQPYKAMDEQRVPKLDKLGLGTWKSKKVKVKHAVMIMAQQLLDLYAKREVLTRPAYKPGGEDFLRFEEDFAFDATADQEKAIADVIQDFAKNTPMDRLICGDVGYGKTEVAIRAAMMAVLNNYQVAVLAPTTVLTQQHFITFKQRFASTAVNIAVISRFQSTKEVKAILKQIKEGKIDIVIGTHRILSNDVIFKTLQLVVVDEEQRFGIKAKEHLKKLRSKADILTLSATPIPRTLQMALFNVRDLSVIETAPVDRQSIQTSICPFDDNLIKEAILFEINRGGQVYFVHNQVESISAMACHIKNLLPLAKVEVAHGQMDNKSLENSMLRFINGDINVFVCTTIIENGIDVPNANTMIVNNAANFGLSQLYQLRGRIGRGDKKSYAYLLTDKHGSELTVSARKRLEVLKQFSELGAGFKIARHDLQLRGAGDFLGKSQHGHIAAVGYELYMQLVKEAVAALRGQKFSDDIDPDIKVPFSALIPENYISDVHLRLGYYQKLAQAQNLSQLHDIINEMNEQFGPATPEIYALANTMHLKQLAKKIGAIAVDVRCLEKDDPPQLLISLNEKHHLNANKLINFISANSDIISLTASKKLLYKSTLKQWQKSQKSTFKCSALMLEEFFDNLK